MLFPDAWVVRHFQGPAHFEFDNDGLNLEGATRWQAALMAETGRSLPVGSDLRGRVMCRHEEAGDVYPRYGHCVMSSVGGLAGRRGVSPFDLIVLT